jgi:hypothetical protein
MKVQYLKDYPDNSVMPGFVFKSGWTAEHPSDIAQARIDAGVCQEIDPEARARRSDKVVMECAAPPMKPAKAT